MIFSTPLARKIAYLLVIGFVLIPLLYIWGQPATPSESGQSPSRGGLLSRNRQYHGLSETQLGQIDPTSETIKWATLGLRGVASQILWQKANQYKMKEDFINYKATLEQITKVQPHIISVWIFLAWNLSYNVSVEFDDFRERYRWVIKGIQFLKEGIAHNPAEPRLQYELGRIISQKIGTADEHLQFRKLFKEDEDFHGTRPLALRDNWLVGKEWYDQAAELAKSTGKGVRKLSPLLYLSSGPMCLMNYAAALEEEGTFGEVAGLAWKRAAITWRDYGDQGILNSWGETLRLNDEEFFEAQAKELAAKLDALQPGLREQIIAEKRAKLSEKQRHALEIPPEKRALNPEEYRLGSEAEELLKTTHEEVARRISGPRRSEAKKLAEKAKRFEELAYQIRGDREIVNFNYWRMRAEVEQSSEALAARKLIYLGTQKYREIDLLAARKLYDEGLVKWRALLDRFPALAKDDITVDDLMDDINRYRRLLNQMDEPFPKPFILQDIIDRHEKK